MQLSHHYATDLSETVSPVTPQPLSDLTLCLTNTALAEQFNLPTEWFTDQGIIEQIFSEQGALGKQAVAQ